MLMAPRRFYLFGFADKVIGGFKECEEALQPRTVKHAAKQNLNERN